MFTRYSDINIPNNYSGNRFKKTTIEDTTMKIHESELKSEIKTSVSPTYNEWLYSSNDTSSISDADNFKDNENTDKEIDNQNTNYSFDDGDKTEEIKQNTENDFSENASKTDIFNLEQILKYLKNIKTDDLLLILLIIFLASDKNSTNTDVIILLALLLTLQ